MSGLCSLTGYVDEDEPFKTGISYGDPGRRARTRPRRSRSPWPGASAPARAPSSTWPSARGRPRSAGEAFVAASLRGETTPRHLGNRSPTGGRPQGAYRCAGDDQWIVVSVVTDDEWRACCAVLGRDDLAGLSLDERQARHDELDEVIADWARDRDPQDAMETPPGGRGARRAHPRHRRHPRGSAAAAPPLLGRTCPTRRCTATSRPASPGGWWSATPRGAALAAVRRAHPGDPVRASSG